MVHDQGLPGRQVGTEWRFLKSAIQDWLRTGAPPWLSSNEALMALVETFRYDPDLPEIVKEAYSRRGRAMTEDE
jgi:hypothetical protein